MFSSLCSFSNLSSVFFLHSPFSRLAPLSVTTLLSFSKILPPLVFLSFSKNRLPLWFCSLPCIYRQPGERFTIPCPSAGHGGVGVAGYGCVGVGMGHAGFLGKWGGEREEKNSGKQRFKIFFFPASACAGKKNLHRAVQNGTVQFFFLFFFGFKKKKKKIWK
jgi:hypothetical protein